MAVDIDILCKVVDNFGDIGVACRLARALSELPEPPRLRLVVDDLGAFSALDPAVDTRAPNQLVHGWEIHPWKGSGVAEALRVFRARPPRIVIECFACGRPDWLEELLFDPEGQGCFIVDLEHLTAEPWAEDFHRLPSLTRSKAVRKAIFLPGFAEGTGGLILDSSFARSRERAVAGPGRLALRRELLAAMAAGGAGRVGGDGGEDGGPARPEEAFWLGVFSYERDYGRIVADLAAFGRGRSLLVLAAAGRSQGCLLEAWSRAGKPFGLVTLPFLPQELWDSLLLACDFSIVRGEDSWSRAALSGRPFLWQAYPQEGRHHLVKVRAFLEALRPFLPEASFAALEALYLAFNDRERDWSGERGEEELLPVLEDHPGLLLGFSAFSASAAGRGDLAANLLTFLAEIV
jgi:uncharacterized repeat protein (TIGR03837 family)